MRLVADIDLDQEARPLSQLLAGARDSADQRGTVDRMDRVEQRHRILGLVRLELADQVEDDIGRLRSEEHTSELQSLMRISYAVFCLKKKNQTTSVSSTMT